MRSIKAKPVIRELVKFFTRFGLPKEVQSDQGSNFMSTVFKQSLQQLGIVQITSTSYHPQSQGAIERFHQTLKTILRKLCVENPQKWDEVLPYVLFAIREAPNVDTGFSPFYLMFGRDVRGPLKILRDQLLSEKTEKSLLQFVCELRERLSKAWALARENLTHAQGTFKKWYDRKAVVMKLQPGDRVLVLLPLVGHPLTAKYQGPYNIVRRIGEVNYIVATPDRRKKERMCHVNILKPYFDRKCQSDDSPEVPVGAVVVSPKEEVTDLWESVAGWRECPESGSGLLEKLAHLPEDQRTELLALFDSYQDVFRETPGRTTAACHDVDVGDAPPVKQAPYRVNPQRAKILRQELDYMLQHDLIRPGQSEWSSPVTLVPKPGGSYRFCIDYRRLNSVTKTDTYPLPLIDDCIDQIGNAQFITKFDLLKGYWQVPLTPRAQECSCFVALGRTYLCNVMPYGMKNAPATFQRLMNNITADVPNCVVYIDDIVVHSETWQEHLLSLEMLLQRLSEAKLVVNIDKCEFTKAQVQYLGYVVGYGNVLPPLAKVKNICEIPTPQTRTQIRRFIGMVGYYRRFIVNFATIVAPLTDLLKKGQKFVWSSECEESFTMLKVILCSAPILKAPSFKQPFKLYCDASEVGAGAVLMQEDESGVDHPVCFYSNKFSPSQRNYSTIEKELLSLILALRHFAVYVGPSGCPVTVFTDHHPLKYLSKFRDKNQRLTRWSLFLQEYNLQIEHIPGKDNVLADFLSRVTT